VGDGYNHIRHDDYDAGDYADALIRAADDREILAEAPFRAQALTERLQAAGIAVESYYVDEPLEVCRSRFEQRERRPLATQHQQTLRRYAARQWDHRGTSEQIRDLLKR